MLFISKSFSARGTTSQPADAAAAASMTTDLQLLRGTIKLVAKNHVKVNNSTNNSPR